MLAEIGFERVEIRERFDPFRGTSKEKVSRKLQVGSVNVLASKRGP